MKNLKNEISHTGFISITAILILAFLLYPAGCHSSIRRSTSVSSASDSADLRQANEIIRQSLTNSDSLIDLRPPKLPLLQDGHS